MNTGVADSRYVKIIGFISVVVPLVVAFLIFMPSRLEAGSWVKTLPHLNAVINSATALLLLAGLYFIRKRNIELHRAVMLAAFTLGALFLVSYIIYHASVPSVVFGDVDGDGLLSEAEKNALGASRGIYLFVLLSHIALSFVVVPFVLMALFFALKGQNARHRKVVKFAYPVWLYVSITGVIVYLMINPYYQ